MTFDRFAAVVVIATGIIMLLNSFHQRPAKPTARPIPSYGSIKHTAVVVDQDGRRFIATGDTQEEAESNAMDAYTKWIARENP